METYLLLTLVALSLTFDFLNGFQDSANIVATMISSRAMTPKAALFIAASANFVGPFIFGVAVAETIGKKVTAPNNITIAVVLAALLSASLWNIFTWAFGIPSSSSHALIGGIIGAVFLESGYQVLNANGLLLIGTSLFLSPLLGFIFGLMIMRLTLKMVRNATPKIDRFFKIGQIPTAVVLALGHGTNDAQKTMGIITLGLVTLGQQATFHIPVWVKIASAFAIAAGTATGGWRIIHTLGGKFYRIRPIHSLTSQIASTSVIIGSSLFGGPVSTTHVVSSSIIGVGAGQRKSQVRWGVLKEIMIAWFLTVPVTAGLSALLYIPINHLINTL